MTQEDIDLVAGDFNGASWRRKTVPEQQYERTLEEAFRKARLPVPLGSTPLLGLGGVPHALADVCGFVKPPNSHSELLTRWRGAFESDREDFGLSPKDQTSHYESWLHPSHVSTPLVERVHVDMINGDQEVPNAGCTSQR